MGAIPIFKGVRLRATKVDRCGLPLEGPGNRLVTTGFISLKVDPVMKERTEQEQINAEGKVCFQGTTPATRKYHKIDLALCGVDPDLYAMMTGGPRILDYDGETVIGWGDSPDVDDKTGVALEVWTTGQSDDDCPEPVNDDVFSQLGDGINYLYGLIAGTEWVPSGVAVGSTPSDFSLSGISIPMNRWGRGPYNVARTDAAGTPGRLLAPVGKVRHYTWFKTPVPPPDATAGAVPLAVKSIFEGKYFGAQALPVAPPQPSTPPPVTVGPDADGLYPTPQAAGPDADGLYPPTGGNGGAAAAAGGKRAGGKATGEPVAE